MQRRPDGTIRADAFITRCGVFSYIQPDGTVRKELRLPDDVYDQASLDSFAGVPITNDHPHEMVDATNAKKYAVGSLQGGVTKDDDHLRGHIAVYDGDTIADMERGKRSVSAGYTCDLLEKPGTHPIYGAYDAVQKNIRANHIAIVDVARAGSTARVRLDAAECMDAWTEEAREASAETRKANAQGPAEKSGGMNTRTAELAKYAKGALKKSPLAVAAEVEKHGKAYEAKKGEKAPKMSKEAARAEFEKLHAAPKQAAAAEWERLRAKKAQSSFNASLAKYVSKKDCGILGMSIASRKKHAMLDSMGDTATNLDAEDDQKTQGGSPADKDPDPKDEASRSKTGEAKVKKPAASEEESVKDAGGEGADPEDPDTDEDPDDPDDDGDDDEEVKDDAYTTSYDEDGELTPDARHKLSTTSFAVPDREGLPIHDPDHTRAAMSRFGQYEFKSPEEKHAAFNRVSKRAKHFGISSDGFEKAHKNTLDREDDDMINQKLKTERDAAVARADKADQELAKAQGELASAKKDLDAAQSTRVDAADVQKQVDAKVALVMQARETGAKVEAAMSPIEIKRAVVKHVDGDDVDAKKPEAYVDALFDGALRRAKKDAKDTQDGEEALLAARKAAVGAPGAPVVKNDADDLDEEAAARRARTRSANAWMTQETK